jgi:hypothetical protein
MPDVGDANEMSERARDLLTRANRDGDLDPRVIARVRGAVLAEIGAAAAAGVTVGAAARAIAAKTSVAPLAPAALAGSGVAGAGLAVKAAALALIIGVAAAGGYGAGRRSALVAATPVATTTIATAITIASAPAAVAIASAPTATEPAALPVPTLAPIAPPAAPPAASPSMPKVATPVTPPVTPAFGAPASTPWARDMANLHDAQAALVAGDPRGALKLASLVDPQGPFAGERDAMSLVARCSMDPTDAKAITEARTFETAHAGTPLAERVRAACSGGS